MTWRLKHKLFGWHYASLTNTACSIVRRVRMTAAGERYVTYFSGHLVFIDRPDCSWAIVPLTWRA